MVSEMAMMDLQAIIDAGGIVSPRDVVKLNALALDIQKKTCREMYTLPRVAQIGGLMLREPDVRHEIYLDECARIFEGDDPSTYILVQAWVLANTGDALHDENLLHPENFIGEIRKWVVENLGSVTISQIAQAVFYVLYGCDPETGEYPEYITDAKDENSVGGERSWPLRDYLEATSLGIESPAALRMTSPQLAAVIERAYIVRGMPLKKDEAKHTGAYFRELDRIKASAQLETDGTK